jgi:predicted HTH transcriptional regulator
MTYAVVISAFANADGGTLVLGYDERTKAVGVNDAGTVRRAIDRALAMVEPPAVTEVLEHQIDDGVVFTIEVRPSRDVHMANGVVAVRQGASNRPMTGADVRKRLGVARDPSPEIAELLERLLHESAEWPDHLMQEIAEHDSERDAREAIAQEERDRKARALNIKIALISGVLSVIAGALLSLLLA